MKLSLATRLVLLVLAITMMATAILAFIVHRATSSEFVNVMREELPHAVDPERQEALAKVIEDIYDENGGAALKRAVQGAELPSGFDNMPFVIVDTRLDVIATTESPFSTAVVTRLENGGLRFVVAEQVDGEFFDIELTALSPRQLRSGVGNVFGELILLPEPVDEKSGNEFAARIWQDAAPWLVLVLAIAAVLTTWLMRRALKPIDDLTQAASQLKCGEFPDAISMAGGGAEFDKLIATFNAATKALSETDRIRRQLISDIAHELRTPVTNIKGQLEAVQQGLIDPDTDFRKTLQAETRLLERLVEDFQEIAITDAGQLRLTLQPIPLRETADNIVGTLAAQAGAEFTNRIPDGYAVVADEERLRQILTNLFDNARREMPTGLQVTTNAEGRGDSIIMRFEDNGPGIAEADRPHVFERFYRAEKSRNRSTGGAGLGLTIVEGLVLAMNGTIECEPGRTGGAAFIISLPAAIPEDDCG